MLSHWARTEPRRRRPSHRNVEELLPQLLGLQRLRFEGGVVLRSKTKAWFGQCTHAAHTDEG